MLVTGIKVLVEHIQGGLAVGEAFELRALQILGPVSIPFRLRDQVFVEGAVFLRVYQIQRAGLDSFGDFDIEQHLIQRDAKLPVRGGQRGALRRGQKIIWRTLVDVAVLLLVVPQSVPQRRFATVRRDGDAALQLKAALFEQREVVLTLLKFFSILLELIDLLFDLSRFRGFRIERFLNQGDLLAVSELRVSHDIPD